MQISVKKFDPSFALVWDEFVMQQSLNGTFLHSRTFYDHNPLNADDDHSLLFYRNNLLLGLIPFNLSNHVLHSHNRATYGGFIINKEAGTEAVDDMVKLVIEAAAAAGVNEIIIRNPFRIFSSNNCDESDYAMWRNNFKIKFRELEVAIKLGESVKDGYSDATKRSIQKGRKSVTVEESNDFEVFWKILETNLSEKHNTTPTHDFAQFMQLHKNVGSDKIKLFAAKLDGEMIAGIVLFIVNANAVHAQYIASDYRHQEHRPLNVIIDHIIDWANERGYKYFNLGMANQDNGQDINEGLFRFKEGFGGRGVMRETMHLQLNNTN